MNKIYILLVFTLLSFSCQNNFETADLEPVQKQVSLNDSLFVNEQAAIGIAEELSAYFGNKNPLNRSSQRSTSATKKVKAIKTVKDRKNKDAYYVMNYEQGGFAVISADKRTESVLAFSDKNEFITDSVPSGLN